MPIWICVWLQLQNYAIYENLAGFTNVLMYLIYQNTFVINEYLKQVKPKKPSKRIERLNQNRKPMSNIYECIVNTLIKYLIAWLCDCVTWCLHISSYDLWVMTSHLKWQVWHIIWMDPSVLRDFLIIGFNSNNSTNCNLPQQLLLLFFFCWFNCRLIVI